MRPSIALACSLILAATSHALLAQDVTAEQLTVDGSKKWQVLTMEDRMDGNIWRNLMQQSKDAVGFVGGEDYPILLLPCSKNAPRTITIHTKALLQGDPEGLAQVRLRLSRNPPVQYTFRIASDHAIVGPVGLKDPVLILNGVGDLLVELPIYKPEGSRLASFDLFEMSDAMDAGKCDR